MVISGVGNLAEGTIGLEQRVFTLDDVTVADFMLFLVVTSVGVGYGVRVIIFGMGLKSVCLNKYTSFFSGTGQVRYRSGSCIPYIAG